MNLEQFKTLLKTYQEETKENKVERPLTADELNGIEENIANIPDEYQAAFESASRGDFSKFESLPFALRNYLGAKKLQNFRNTYGENPSINDLSVRNHLRSVAMDAAFRAGVSVEKNSPETRANAKIMDSFMNTHLMQKTMIPPTDAEKRALVERIGQANANAVVRQNLEKQRVMAKMLFMAQLGKYEIYEKARLSTELEEPLSETIAHGSRTNFVLPVGEDTHLLFDAFLGNNMGATAGVNKRTAATHYVKRRAIDENGFIKSETKESKTYSPFKVFRNQYGMNIATGGIGVMGPDGNAIVGDGESGHVYMRIEEGDKKHCGSLLFGIEGSEPGKSNYLGHSHSASGTGAKQSAFFADKQIVGKKTGGRQVDLSGISSRQLADILSSFDRKYSELQRNADTKQGRNRLAKINDMLMGNRMSLDKLYEMCNGMGIDGQNLRGTLENARGGYLTKSTASAVSKEEFRQNVRAKISQETACYLAEERFRNAGGDLELSVGALKELMLTHDTRKLSWRLRHPIRNYREKEMIRNLTDRLKNEKHLSEEALSNALNSQNDTFSMYWGDKLSNDYSARTFLRNKSEEFVKENAQNPVDKDVKNPDKAKERMHQEIKAMHSKIRGKFANGEQREEGIDKSMYVYGGNKKVSFDNIISMDDDNPEFDNASNRLNLNEAREPFPLEEEELNDSINLPRSQIIEASNLNRNERSLI